MLGILAIAAALAANAYFPMYKRPDAPPYPAANAYSAARADLGRALFFDPRLSGSGWISCATCHNPAFSWTDGLPKGIGHGMKGLGRRTPTLLDLAWGQLMFWDGRAESLEMQAFGPITAEGEMNMPKAELLAKLNAIQAYKPLFDAAYPGEGVNDVTVAKAIATFERGIVSADAPFDRWVKGDEKAVSAAAKRGFVVFNDKGRCNLCHTGWRFTDDGFHDIGVPGDDPGRGKIVPDVAVLANAFKTPTLRNVDHRAPYMHDGSLKDLAAVVDLYNHGGLAKRPSLSADIKPIGFTAAEKADLIEFLHTLTSADPRVAAPMLPR
jgi:cytochrome c peroxidase